MNIASYIKDGSIVRNLSLDAKAKGRTAIITKVFSRKTWDSGGYIDLELLAEDGFLYIPDDLRMIELLTSKGGTPDRRS